MISVCIPTYNGSKYIKEQLDSILIQLSENDEIIISDDRSTDDTISIIESYHDDRIKIFIHEKINNSYKGPYKNIYYVYRNIENALKHATGDYIFLSDQDDIWLPHKVERMMQAFSDGAIHIQHNNTLIDNNHNVLLDSYFSFVKPANTFSRIVLRCFIQGASMAFTQTVLKWSLPFPQNPISHDHWIAYNAYFRGYDMTLINEPLLLYRRHDNNVSPSGNKSSNPLWFKLSYRFRLVWAIVTIRLRINKN
ncbi:glycosyltransferase [Dysgonomonas sp. HDW5B]|uniref:glycosyltransferase n=1 Tax=Dysgonomonas sp. HDW5B TaxID=2714927 RepID=UPI00140E2501|nr:glycosyltransferase [Dysgonomonas sp. HDW5B]QIK54167.1 glycosyltransferase [Dysgonomonas sp. HDW5B]